MLLPNLMVLTPSLVHSPIMRFLNFNCYEREPLIFYSVMCKKVQTTHESRLTSNKAVLLPILEILWAQKTLMLWAQKTLMEAMKCLTLLTW